MIQLNINFNYFETKIKIKITFSPIIENNELIKYMVSNVFHHDRGSHELTIRNTLAQI